MLDKSISLLTPMFHLPRGLVRNVLSCHFSGTQPALSATSKTKFLTYMKEFICQRTYLSFSPPKSIKSLVFIIRLLIQDQKYSVWGGKGGCGIQSQDDLIRKADHGTISTQTGKGLVLCQTSACRLISFCCILYRGYEWLRRHISTCTMWLAQDLPVGLNFNVIPEWSSASW